MEDASGKATGDKLVLIAVDSSRQAEHAVKYYVDNLHRSDNKILLCHVIELPDLAHAREAYVSPLTLSELWNEELVKAHELEEKFKGIFESYGVTDLKTRIEGGLKPGHSLCRAAEEEGASMIVIGTRGMGSIRRTILGSVSDHVVHHATCPVVVCRQQEEKKK